MEAYAAITIASGAKLRLQHRNDGVTQHHVHAADNSRTGANLAEDAASRGRSHAVGEFNLTHRAHFLRPVLAKHRSAFDEYGRSHVVPRRGVGEQFFQQVTRHATDRRNVDAERIVELRYLV